MTDTITTSTRYKGTEYSMNLKALIWSPYGLAITLVLLVDILQHWYRLKYGLRSSVKPLRDHMIGGKHKPDRIGLKRDLIAYKKKVETAGEMDTSAAYMIVPTISSPELSGANETVTLCTQTTVDHLHYIKDLTDVWHKPISVTVFTHGEEAAFVLHAILFLHSCFVNVHSSVSFHLVYPKLYPPLKMENVFDFEINCSDFESLKTIKKEFNYDINIPYPHNVLRNVAIKYALTPYILLTDIDLIPSKDIAEHFTQFVRGSSPSSSRADDNKVVYVVPTFESKTYQHIPDKQTLITEWKLKNVRQFHVETCPKCHRPTDYNRWINLPTDHIGYVVQWGTNWEPFYFAKKNHLPLYDGRFKQYGYDRISQVCELHYAGYQFAVLNNVFLVHRGFKVPDKFHQHKDAENDKNWILYRSFKKELITRYPKSRRWCI